MQMPWVCKDCKSINMVEMDDLKSQPIDKIRREIGYFCQDCHKFNRIYFSTLSLDAAIENLKRYPATHKNFQFHFAKTFKKAIGVQIWPART